MAQAIDTNQLRKALYIYGNNNLQNLRFQTDQDTGRDASSYDVQRSPKARGIGTVPINFRIDEKAIAIRGGITDPDQRNPNLQRHIDDLKYIFSRNDRLFRTIPEYIILMKPPHTGLDSWSVADDASALSLDNEEFQLERNSLKFTINPATSANTYATIVNSSLPAVNLSSKVVSGVRTGNIEQWVYIPDRTNIDSVEIRFGSSAANYYSATFTSNYEGKGIENGWNLFSKPWKDWTVTGTPVTSSLTYLRAQFNLSNVAATQTAYRIDGMLWVNEDKVRNFAAYRVGGVSIPMEYKRQHATTFSLTLINYKGLATATHDVTVFSQTGVTSISNTQTFELAGAVDLLPVINVKFNAVTNLNQFKITNETTGEYIYFDDTFAINDEILIDNYNQVVTRNGVNLQFKGGKLLSFPKGVNKLKAEVIQNNNLTLDYTSGYDTESYLDGSTNNRLAQSFTPSVSGSLVELALMIRGESPGAGTVKWSLQSDSGSDTPSGTILRNGTFNNTLNYLNDLRTLTFTPINVTNGTKYWLVIQTDASSFYDSTYWKRFSANTYASGSAKSYNGSTWSAVSGDFAFKAQIGQTPSTNFDWSLKYKPLYT